MKTVTANHLAALGPVLDSIDADLVARLGAASKVELILARTVVGLPVTRDRFALPVSR